MKTATATFALPLIQHQCYVTVFSRQSLSPPKNPISFPRYRRRYSNTRTFRNQNTSNFRYGGDDNDDDDDDEKGDLGRRRRRPWLSGEPLSDQDSGIVGEFIDSVWIFKVFQSYGLMLPAIIISIVLATGPKAFLMALALPIGQSALTLAFTKLRGTKQDNPKCKTKTKKAARVNFSSNVELGEEEEGENQGTRKGKVRYRSWVSPDDVSVNKDSQNPSNFGGWDDLDRMKVFDTGTSRSSARTGRSGRMRTEKGKFSKRERRSDTPLLLRLLIAVFPFLSSWSKMQ